MQKRTKIARVPEDIINDINHSMDIRFKNNLISRRDLKLAEGFRLVKRMPEWSLALEKLKKLPKKEDAYK